MFMIRHAKPFALIATCCVAAFVAGRISTNSNHASAYQSDIDTVAGQRAASQSGGRRFMESTSRGELGIEKDMKNKRRSAGSGLMEATANYDAFLRLEIITSNPDPIQRVEQWLDLIESCDAEEIQYLYKKMSARGTTSDNSLEHSLAQEAWAALHPKAALAEAINRSWGSLSRRAIMSYFVGVDPQAAIRWAKENNAKGEGGVGDMMEYAIQALAPSDPKYATQLLSEAQNPEDYDEALQTLCLQYVDQGADTARLWAVGIDNEKLRDLAIAQVSQNLALHDPRGAADMLIANPGEKSAGAMQEVMKQMTRVDSQGAISYLEMITDPAIKKGALGGIASELASSDSKAALNLIDASPQLADDGVLDNFIWGARESDRALAADTIARIQDPGVREQTYKKFSEYWARNDPEGAKEWLANREFPEKLRKTLEENIRYYTGYWPRKLPNP